MGNRVNSVMERLEWARFALFLSRFRYPRSFSNPIFSHSLGSPAKPRQPAWPQRPALKSWGWGIFWKIFGPKFAWCPYYLHFLHFENFNVLKLWKRSPCVYYAKIGTKRVLHCIVFLFVFLYLIVNNYFKIWGRFCKILKKMKKSSKPVSWQLYDL